MHLSAPASLSVRADVPYADINAYYSSVPSCAQVCEQNYWSKYVKSAKCKGDGTDFGCFCHASIMAAAVMDDTGTRGLCITQSCKTDPEAESAEAAVVGMAMYCALVSYAGTADSIPDTGNVADLSDIVSIGPGVGSGTGTGTGGDTGTVTGGTDGASGVKTDIKTDAKTDAKASKAASSFSPSKSLLVFGSLLISLAVLGQV